jgi:hypothetical protein
MRGRTLLIAGLLTAAYAGQAAAQVASSPHDLSALNGTADNEEICVYCHTPHGAQSADAPLWNKVLTTQTFNNYSSTTMDGTVQTVGSVSIACLTCHDGTLGVDAIVNMPNSGLNSTLGVPTLISSFTGNDNADLGIDLSNDHPVGMVYAGFSGVDGDFVSGAALVDMASSGAGTGPWFVDTGAADTNRDKDDMILYTRNDGGSDEPYVECATCHDPHKGDNPTNEVNFMRLANVGSAVCLACHVK